MSIKNQSRFTIFASLIVGVTILALIGLYLIVDKISKINSSPVTRQEPPRGLKLPAQGGPDGQGNEADDVYKPDFDAPDIPAQPSKLKAPTSTGAMRRMNNGRNAAEFEQKPAPAANPSQKPVIQPPQQPDMRQGLPPGYPDPSKMSPEERESFEREMYRRQQMMQQQPGYPSDYPPVDYYPYDRAFEDDYYDYDPGYRGQNDAKSSQLKLSDSTSSPDYDEEDDEEYEPDEYLNDDYLRGDE